MTNPVDAVVGIVALNGGKLVGKTRLQKVAYLLDACGMNSGFDYDYHHFGPYSADVALAADVGELMGRLNSEEKPGFHSVPYVIYQTDEPAPETIGEMGSDEIREKLSTLDKYSALVLELAATVCFLENEEGYSRGDAQKEVVVRKAAKASADRLIQANELLEKLELH